MSITTILALCLIALLYVVLSLSNRKHDRDYQRLIKRTGKRLANELIRDTKKRYPQRSLAWVLRKIMNDLDKGKV